MPRLGQRMPEHSKKLIGLAVRERIEQEGFRPGQSDHGWSEAESDEERMRRWRAEL